MKNIQRILFWLIVCSGWLLNFAQLIQILATPGVTTPLYMIKVSGVLIPPLGTVMGYIGLF